MTDSVSPPVDIDMVTRSAQRGDHGKMCKVHRMAIDYDAIRESNIKEHGTGTRLLALLGTLYSDRTHFIFELLQNAEDAGATQVFFDLHLEHLEFYHDGRSFDEKDVRGICGVADSTMVWLPSCRHSV